MKRSVDHSRPAMAAAAVILALCVALAPAALSAQDAGPIESYVDENGVTHYKTGNSYYRAQSAAAESRAEYASQLENRMLDKGFDMKIVLGVGNDRKLEVSYVLMNRPLARRLVNGRGFYDTVKRLGFTEVEFNNGHGESWKYDIK